jgi:hypothetical protein
MCTMSASLLVLVPSGLQSVDTPSSDLDEGIDIAAQMGLLGGHFIENRGQVADGIRYYSRGNPSVAFRDDGVMFVLTEAGEQGQDEFTGPEGPPHFMPPASDERSAARSYAYLIRFEGSNKVAPLGVDELPFNSNFFIGNDSSKWLTDVSNFGHVTYRNLYDGIDLVYGREQRGVKYEFIVGPGADPEVIRITYEGIDTLSLMEGRLVADTKLGGVTDASPYSYQETGLQVKCHFVMAGRLSFGFECGDWDASKTLVIDPLIYSTYLGGNQGERLSSAAMDSARNLYITGTTYSANFPTTPGAFDTIYGGGQGDAFVTKLNANGSSLVYSTFLAGNHDCGYCWDDGFGITVDSDGNAYITGMTANDDFPVTPGAYDTTFNDPYDDVFLTKLNATGNGLIYSTYIGGGGHEYGESVAVDSAGNAYITGTSGQGYPVTPGALFTHVSPYSEEIFVTKFNAFGSALVYSALFGGSYADYGISLRIDTEGNVYLAGMTSSYDFQVTPGAFDTHYDGASSGSDAYVAKLDANGSKLLYATFLGGYDYETLGAIAIDSAGNAFVTGATYSSDFPTTVGAYDRTFGGLSDAYVSKLNPSGSGLVYSTLIGANNYDMGYSIELDAEGDAYVTGMASSPNFPVTPNAFDIKMGGNCDAFVSEISPAGDSLINSTFFGGSDNDHGYGIVVPDAANVYIIGATWSGDLPTSPDAFDKTFGGADVWYGDGFAAKLSFGRNNTPPAISSFTATVVQEGFPVLFSVSANDAQGDILTYDFDFESDGTIDVTGPNNTATHTWGDDFAGMATVKVSDGTGSVEATTDVKVLNILPSGSATISSAQHEGNTIQLSAHVADPGSDDLFLTWHWGDGTPDSTSTYYNNGVSPDPYPSTDIHPRDITDTKSHTYGDNGAFTVTVFIQDDDSGNNGTTLKITATPDNLPPSVSVSGGMNIDEGQSVSLTATATDPGSDDLKFDWSWGEGSSDSKTYYNDGIGPDPPNSPGGTWPFAATDAAAHAYGDNGIYAVSLKVTDDDGGSITWAGQLAVANLPPTIAPFGPFTVCEGDLLAMNTTATDPGSDDLVFSRTFELGPTLDDIHYNNGIGPDPPQSPGGAYPFTASDSAEHTYGDNGVYVVTLTVTDDDGGSASYSTEVNVTNLPPSITPFGPFEVNEADPLTVATGTTDPGSDDLTFTWTFEYGPTMQDVFYNDGIGPDPPKSPEGVFPFSAADTTSHTYGDNGVFKIVLAVQDDDGGFATYETLVTVFNIAPVIDGVQAYVIANLTLRVAGEKWHDVCMDLVHNGNIEDYACVIRYPGSPDDQSKTITGRIHLLGDFKIVLYYTPDDDPVNGQPNGANPAWVTIAFPDGLEVRLHHTFNVRHDDTWVWTIAYFSAYLVGQSITFNATASDVGSDDLTFTWDWGDGTPATATTYFSDGTAPDPYPSPGGTFPFTAMDSQVHRYSSTGRYDLKLTVRDDDGDECAALVVIVIDG